MPQTLRNIQVMQLHCYGTRVLWKTSRTRSMEEEIKMIKKKDVETNKASSRQGDHWSQLDIQNQDQS